MQSVGFEPTHPKILRPERSALDHSGQDCYDYVVTIVTLWSNRLIR